jgi:hypothetical protein
MNNARLLIVQKKIESMSSYHQIEVLKLLCKHNAMLNTNKNGVHVNLSMLNDSIVDELFNFIKYVETQEEQLSMMEVQQEQLKTNFMKDTKG